MLSCFESARFSAGIPPISAAEDHAAAMFSGRKVKTLEDRKKLAGIDNDLFQKLAPIALGQHADYIYKYQGVT